MAKLPELPDMNSLGQRPIPTYQGFVTQDRSAGAVGDAIAGVGSQLAQFGEQRMAREDQLSYASAKAYVANADAQARLQLSQDPDFETAQERYQQQMKTAQGTALGLLRSNKDRAAFEVDSGSDINRGSLLVAEMAQGKRKDQGRADLSSTLDTLSKNAADANDDGTRQNIFGTVHDLLAGAHDNGFISAEEVGAMARNFSASDAGARIQRSLIEDNVDGASKLLADARDAMSPQQYNQYLELINKKMEVRQSASDFAAATIVPPIEKGAGSGGTVMGYSVAANPDKSTWDKRADGSTKGMGWLGLLKRPGGGVSSEISVGVEINGKETEIPLMVPTLTKSELDYLMTHDPSKASFQKNMPASILSKAEDFASNRIAQGLRPFRQDGEPPAVTPTAAQQGGQPVPNGEAAIKSIFPNAVVTSNYRAPDNPLSKANPQSWHTKSHAAVDVVPIKGMTFDQFVSQAQNAGYKVIEALDETKNPSPTGSTADWTGPHWHIVLGEAGPQQGPVRWDKNQVFANIDALADKEGWTFERRERAKDYASSQIGIDDNLLSRQEQDADRQAQEIILQQRDKFTDATAIPRGVWSKMSVGMRSQAMDLAQRNSQPKDVKPNGEVAMMLHAMMYTQPDQFANFDLSQAVGKVSNSELDSLISEQAKMHAPGYKQAESPRSEIASNIAYHMKIDPQLAKALDPKNNAASYSAVAQDMEAYLNTATGGKRRPTDQEMDAAFARATAKSNWTNTFLGLNVGTTQRPQYAITVGMVPDDIKSRIVSAYKQAYGGLTPDDNTITRIYARNKGQKGFWP